MQARDIFGLILRCLALWILFWSAYWIVGAMVNFPATIESYFTHAPAEPSSIKYLAYGVPGLLIGILVLRFADDVIAFTYRDRPGR